MKRNPKKLGIEESNVSARITKTENLPEIYLPGDYFLSPQVIAAS